MSDDTMRLKSEVIQYMTAEIGKLLICTSNPHGEQKHIIVTTKLNSQTDNDSLIVSVQLGNLEGTIGVWFGSKTADIDIFSRIDGESLYEFHDIFSGMDKLTLQISNAFALYCK
jgi:hypothetical protein